MEVRNKMIKFTLAYMYQISFQRKCKPPYLSFKSFMDTFTKSIRVTTHTMFKWNLAFNKKKYITGERNKTELFEKQQKSYEGCKICKLSNYV